MKRFRSDIINWDSDIAKFETFDDFVEKRIFIPPKILLVGENGVGKTSIMKLFPGDIIVELDNDMNECIQKSIYLQSNDHIIACIIKEINIQDILDKPNVYRQTLDSADIICLITNSGASNLTRTKRLFSLLKPLVTKPDFYVIANFQDIKLASFDPSKIEHFFDLKTFGFSAASNTAEDKIRSIFREMLNNTKLVISRS
jgi:GTPase SAR1 family protein